MQWASAKARWILAGGVALSGAGYAAVLAQTAPAPTGVSTAEIRAIAARTEQTPLPEISLGKVAPTAPVGTIKMFRPTAAPSAARRVASAPMTRLNVPILPGNLGGASLARPAAARPAAAPGPPPAPVDPVRNIALMGVTHQNDEDVAWLVNLESQDREMVSVGEAAFGFSVREIGPDSVQLTRGGEDHLLRLGDKQIPVNEAPPAVVSAAAAPAAGSGGQRRGGRGRWGGSANGGVSGFGGRSGGRRSLAGNFGAGNFGGPAGSAGDAQGSSSFSRGSRQTGVQRRGALGTGGGFGGGGGFSGRGGFSGGSSGGNNQFAATASGPTSNPQTARRRGGQLTGDADPIQPPQAITNPQTQRRLGTAAAGAAFGQAPAGQPQPRQGQNRGGGFQR